MCFGFVVFFWDVIVCGEDVVEVVVDCVDGVEGVYVGL